jgi:hypothetical protein
MKLLKNLNLGFTAVLIIGLYIAWQVTIPAQVTGERYHGKCKHCVTDTWTPCGPKIPGSYDSCGVSSVHCVMLSTSHGDCYQGSPSGCMTNSNCKARWNEACVGG